MVLSEKSRGSPEQKNFQQGAAAGGETGLLRKASIVNKLAPDAYGKNPGVKFQTLSIHNAVTTSNAAMQRLNHSKRTPWANQSRSTAPIQA